jgi:MamL-1 domain
MTSIKTESLSEPEEDIDKRSPPRQHDRFLRRLNKYRIHQSDCKMKSDFSSRELCEQESFHIEKLQRFKAAQGKPKRASKKKVKVSFVFLTAF